MDMKRAMDINMDKEMGLIMDLDMGIQTWTRARQA
jgi:hypothetical protein